MIRSILVVAALANQQVEWEKLPVLRDDIAFEGTWELISLHYQQDRIPTQERRMIVEGGTWRERFEGGSFYPLKVCRRAAEPWPRIDRTSYLGLEALPGTQVPSVTSMLGVAGMMVVHERGSYHLDGDDLTIVIGPWGGPPLDRLEPAPGRNVEVWLRVQR